MGHNGGPCPIAVILSAYNWSQQRAMSYWGISLRIQLVTPAGHVATEDFSSHDALWEAKAPLSIKVIIPLLHGFADWIIGAVFPVANLVDSVRH